MSYNKKHFVKAYKFLTFYEENTNSDCWFRLSS